MIELFVTVNTEIIYIASAMGVLIAGVVAGCILFQLVERKSVTASPGSRPVEHANLAAPADSAA